jgi:hypothetical protein
LHSTRLEVELEESVACSSVEGLVNRRFTSIGRERVNAEHQVCDAGGEPVAGRATMIAKIGRTHDLHPMVERTDAAFGTSFVIARPLVSFGSSSK